MSINHAEQKRTGPFWEAPELVKAGYWVFPVDGKIPITQGSFYGSANDMSEVAEWIQQGHGTHDLAIGTGFYSRVVVIDADDKESYDKMVAKYGPPTYTTKRGGHWLFKHPRNGKVLSNKIAPGLDRKGDGGIAVVPPSKGRKWTNGIPRVEDLPMLPREFWSKTKGPTSSAGERTIPQERKDAASEAIAERVRGIKPDAPGGGRHEHLRHLCGVLLGREVSLVDAEDILKAAWGKVGGDLSERAEREIPNTLATTQQAIANGNATGVPSMEEITPGLYAALEAVMQWPPLLRISVNGHGGQPARGYNATDLGNCGRLIAHHGEDLRYCYPWARWLVWDSRRWAVDNSGEVHRRAKRAVKEIYREAADATDDESRKALAKHAMRSEAENRIQAMVSLAKSEVPVMPEELDRDPWLLNVSNGTIDLRNGELRDHGRDDLITKLAPVDYDPHADAPTWRTFLGRVLPGEELRAFVQRAAGYSATGDTSEQCMFIHHGSGANGKSTLQETLAAALGDYAVRTPTETLMVKRSGGVPNDVARLKGARFVTASETEEGRRLAESLVKDLTSQDTISARFMRAEWFDFEPTHALHLSTNHKPEIRGTDTAIWRRIRLIPWVVTIPPAEQDRELLEKLRAELPGVLAWIARGCSAWVREGLKAHEEVRQATKDYRADMDVLAAFLTDCCVRGEGEEEFAGELWGAWKRWSEETGEQTGTQKRFGGRLAERGFLNHRDSKTGRKVWAGVSLRPNWESRAGISLNHWSTGIAIGKGNPKTAEPSEPKNNIDSLNLPHEEVMCKQGSDGSDGSAEPGGSSADASAGEVTDAAGHDPHRDPEAWSWTGGQ